jgi:2-C-methyl-D-erythritol 4-phosphate cytidylyltransferase
LIPCAGTGSRAGTAQPKQYQLLAGKALVLHTLAAFAAVAAIRRTLVLLAPGDPYFAALDTAGLPALASAACGASSRAGTVANGLVALRAEGAHEDDWVLVHDAARCLVTPALITRLLDACGDDAVGGLLALPVADTIKMAQGERVATTVDRSRYWLAQTPQMFRLGVLQRALAHAGDGVTDEASAIESLGQAPRLVPGDPTNFKVTVAQDFMLAQAILQARADRHDPEMSHARP